MAKSDTLKRVKNLLENFPLKDILETAEVIALMIPAIGNVLAIIIKILKILLSLQPTAVKSITAVEAKMEGDERSRVETFNRLWTIAISDGCITDEEKEFLCPYATAASISNEEFELMIITKTNPLLKIINNYVNERKCGSTSSAPNNFRGN